MGIAREIGYRLGEAADLGNLGDCYADLGQIPRAIESHEQALAIAREIGFRQGEAADLCSLGGCASDQGRWVQAADYHRQAVGVADPIDYAQTQAEAAGTWPGPCSWPATSRVRARPCRTPATYPYPPALAGAALVDGIARLRRGDIGGAQQSFHDAVGHADQRLDGNLNDYGALDTKALALAGLTLTGPTDRTADAMAAFLAARSIITAPGSPHASSPASTPSPPPTPPTPAPPPHRRHRTLHLSTAANDDPG